MPYYLPVSQTVLDDAAALRVDMDAALSDLREAFLIVTSEIAPPTPAQWDPIGRMGRRV